MSRMRVTDANSVAGMAAGRSKGSVFPEGVKVKTMMSGEGAGGMEDYPDKEEDIKRTQDMGVRKIKANRPKPDYRN